MSQPIRVLIVDDEPVARATLHGLLRDEAEVHVVGEAGTGSDALELLAMEEVDLIFLDIDMPGFLGLDLVDRLPEGIDPLVVFVTAHAEYAVRAFELSALDYVLKPFDDDRFRAALDRARKRLKERELRSLGGDLRSLAIRLGDLDDSLGRAGAGGASGVEDDDVQGATGRSGPLRRLAVRSTRGVDFVETAEIDWIEAEDSYVRLWIGDRFYLMRETMTRLEALLDPTAFVRVHRSAIVRLDRVRQWLPLAHGDSKVVLLDGTEVRVSRTRRAAVRARLGLDRADA